LVGEVKRLVVAALKEVRDVLRLRAAA